MARLHHIALGAVDVNGVAEFYRDVLGFEELDRHDDASGELRSIWLDAGGVTLMVERTSERRERVEGVGAGPFLLAISVEPDERAQIEDRLSAAGAEVEERTEHSSYARDPEGNRIAISHHPREPSDEMHARIRDS